MVQKEFRLKKSKLSYNTLFADHASSIWSIDPNRELTGIFYILLALGYFYVSHPWFLDSTGALFPCVAVPSLKI